MNHNERDVQALNRACCGNQQAMQFLVLWRDYVHLVDDIIDEDIWNTEAVMRQRECVVRNEHIGRGSERVCRMGALAIQLYTHPFFLANGAALRQIALNCTNAYADSVRWEKSGVPWQAQFADHARHFGAEMVLAVAGICGGYDHMRSISLELRTICWLEHHTQDGKPI